MEVDPKHLWSALLGAVVGAGLVVYYIHLRTPPAKTAKPKPPKRVILVRHGESEGNVDHMIYKWKADNLLELTDKGSCQAYSAGERILKLVGTKARIDMYVSPFQRSLQTSRNIRAALQSGHMAEADAEAEEDLGQDCNYCRHICVEPRIREQEFGNLQDDDFDKLRAAQQVVGRFWFRFPAGESGADVYGRVKSWWDTQMMHHNNRNGIEAADCVIICTHGLTMRCILMQLFGWSPDTFHTVWNADNCDMYVLKYDENKKGRTPYFLDASEGDMPRSSRKIHVVYKDGTEEEKEIQNYLSIPQPRTTQAAFVVRMLELQHGINPSTVKHVNFHGNFKKFR